MEGRKSSYHPIMTHVIRALQSLKLCVLASDMRASSQMSERKQSRPTGQLMLVSDMQVQTQALFDLVNIIREHEEIFPEWHQSKVADLHIPKLFENKKKSGGYWF